LDAKLEIDSLKASHVVSDEVECADCPIFLADLALFKEKHASVDGVFWYIKHVHYTLVWICLWN
jgi:hypothetical protein